jgi:hypothetical protein
MATTVAQIYAEVTKVFLEDGQFQLGLISDDMFFRALSDTIQDFCTRTGLARDMYNIQITSGTTIYNEPCGLADSLYASYSEMAMYRDSGFSMDQNGPWFNDFGTPLSWREDELPVSQIQITPAPVMDGNYVSLTSVGFGTISASTAGTDFVFNSTNPGYGLISSASTGDVYVDPINEGFGTPFSINVSANNLQVIGNTVPTRLPQLQSNFIPLIPDSFVVYVKYGVLARLFDADSEAKDMARSAYSKSRYEEGVSALALIMGEPVPQG